MSLPIPREVLGVVGPLDLYVTGVDPPWMSDALRTIRTVRSSMQRPQQIMNALRCAEHLALPLQKMAKSFADNFDTKTYVDHLRTKSIGMLENLEHTALQMRTLDAGISVSDQQKHDFYRGFAVHLFTNIEDIFDMISDITYCWQFLENQGIAPGPMLQDLVDHWIGQHDVSLAYNLSMWSGVWKGLNFMASTKEETYSNYQRRIVCEALEMLNKMRKISDTELSREFSPHLLDSGYGSATKL